MLAITRTTPYVSPSFVGSMMAAADMQSPDAGAAYNTDAATATADDTAQTVVISVVAGAGVAAVIAGVVAALAIRRRR
jgi:hypothetical protein